MSTNLNSNSSPNLVVCCNEEFAELCALSTSGRLSQQERRVLENHLVGCADCRTVLRDYKSLASEGMAKIGSVLSPDCDSSIKQLAWNQKVTKARLLARLNASPLSTESETVVVSQTSVGKNPLGLWRWAWIGATAAVFIMSLVFAYQRGVKRTNEAGESATEQSRRSQLLLSQQLDQVGRERRALLDNLLRESDARHLLQQQAAASESKISDLENLKAGLENTIQQLRTQDAQQSTTLAGLSSERQTLRQQLEQSQVALESVRAQLKSAENERQVVLVRSTSLETQIRQLRTQLQDEQDTSGRQQQYLASDRDIRELMGARQLYIADVFDINAQGETKKPFGRVFYTRGKSLIFYAFDLDRQPGYRDAKIFQAWGRQAATQSVPISLGIFYMDNQANRRWALEFDDPKVLEEISSVFVTLEPSGGSKKPTNKPFLVAYLHTAPPNHP